MKKGILSGNQRLKKKLTLRIIISGILFFPQVLFSQVPPLGTCSTFASFSAFGAVSSTGTTVITGDLGTNVGSFTGFPPGIVTGAIHVVDAVSAQAALDVVTAYDFLFALSCDSIIGAALGDNQILPPNIYCIGSAAFINNKLFLDGKGDPNAVFIFKIDGALTTSVEARIVLTNSAAACNIYWQVNGLLTLAANSNFKGTLIANGAINLLDSTSFEGRALTRAGAITLNTTNVNMVCGLSSLPIKLLTFESKCFEEEAILNWSTATEINNATFSIERSINAYNWEKIGLINGAGNSNTLHQYSFTDIFPLRDLSYYRLKQNDFDGNFTYSKTIAHENCHSNQLIVFPNPINNQVNLVYTGDENTFISTTIYNSIGETIYFSTKLESSLNFSQEKEGIYFLHYNLKSGNLIEKIIKH